MHCLDHLGQALCDKGDFTNAEQWFGRALDIIEGLWSQLHPDAVEIYKDAAIYVAGSYDNLAIALDKQGQYDKHVKAKNLFYASLRIRNHFLSEDDLAVIRSYSNLAACLNNLYETDEAITLCTKGIELAEQEHGKHHIIVANLRNNLGLSLTRKGEYKKAALQFKLALVVMRRTHGTSHPETIMACRNLADVFNTLGKYDKAERMLVYITKTEEEVYDELHYEMGRSYHILADTYEGQERYEKAESTYRIAKNIKEKTLGKSHRITANTYNNLSNLLVKIGRSDKVRMTEAKELLQQALSIYEQSEGMQHPATIKIRKVLNSFPFWS